MNTLIVWVMIVVGTGSNYSTGPEFSSKEKCEVAAQTIQKSVDDLRWGMSIKKPLCVRIEK
jgi:hypothetical protein